MKDTKIEWADHTFNPWEGCTRVSPGCAHCYAETRNARFGGGTAPNWGPGAPRRRTSAANWRQPLKWNFTAICDECRETASVPAIAGNLGKCPKCHADAMRRPRVFCASLADWLDDEVPTEWLVDLLDLIRRTPHLDWLLLSKRPDNWRKRIESIKTENVELAAWLLGWMLGDGQFGVGQFDGLESSGPPANVWIGTSVENQQAADERIPALLRIPARVRFLSCEPLLGPVDVVTAGAFGCSCDGEERCTGLCQHYKHAADKSRRGIDWVIAGGESGPKARPMHPDWARSLRDQCAAAGVPFLFKQWGEWLPDVQRLFTASGNTTWGLVGANGFRLVLKNGERDFDQSAAWGPGETGTMLVGKKIAGRLLDGKEHNQFPEGRS